MPAPMFVKMVADDGSWEGLKDQWSGECEAYGEDFSSYAAGNFSELGKLVVTPERRAAVYGIPQDDKIVALFQANVTPLPGYDGPVLRVRLFTLSPDCDFGDLDVSQYSVVLSQTFAAALNLSLDTMRARHLKFHLPSPADRSFFNVVGELLSQVTLIETVQVRGSWLYVTKMPEAR